MTRKRISVLGIVATLLILGCLGLVIWSFVWPSKWAIAEKASWIVTLIALPVGLAIAYFQILPAVKSRADITLSFDYQDEQLVETSIAPEGASGDTKTFLIKSWVVNCGNETVREFVVSYKFPSGATSEFRDKHVDVRSDLPTGVPTGDGFVRDIDGETILVVHVASLLPRTAMPVAIRVSTPTGMNTIAIACTVYTEHDSRRLQLTVYDSSLGINGVQTGRRLLGGSATKRSGHKKSYAPIVPEHILGLSPGPTSRK